MGKEPKLVTTQTDLEQALANGITDLIIDAPDGAWLEVLHDGFLRLWGSSRAVLRGSSSAVLRGSSSAELWGSSSAELRESSRAVLWESSSAELRESSRAVLWESSSAVLWGSSSAELWGSSRAVLWGSSSAVLRGSSSAELRGSSSADTGRWTSVHVWSQRVTLTGDGHVIDMTAVDLTDLPTWRAYVGADTLVRADRDRLLVSNISSQDHPGEMDRDGQIRIGCWQGDTAALRKLIAGRRWPSGADAERRAKFAPRLTAFADLCDAQIAAWVEVAK